MSSNQDRKYLELALEQAELALQENTYPVGAVLVDEQSNVIAIGRNRVHSAQDTTAHAEIDVIRNAGESIFDAKIRQKTFTLYSTLEPCPMCTGGILFSKIKRVVWLLNDEKGFGGLRKMKEAGIFQEKMDRMELIEEPEADLKDKQRKLMRAWEDNPNHVAHLREATKSKVRD
ncbi:tRNA-specific adenosine deaminase [Sporosarcina sp. NCCP-2222]|uniref:nucleoside deaminase n=1 Tax=Sporosarcina sp. NCCP-2222 TaxID=2935073 RepID=UPI002087B421|nr:nucleoside deaminase [Sporosarcina sp. NCCP-2222]GKV56447.1 tRNA-specific adenosine deaminase [Sporosarcina sp. NCCP-2222]